jgi:hypothetical protein
MASRTNNSVRRRGTNTPGATTIRSPWKAAQVVTDDELDATVVVAVAP